MQQRPSTAQQAQQRQQAVQSQQAHASASPPDGRLAISRGGLTPDRTESRA
ncbi:MAG: hypothetical protein L3K13_06075 [Thermoplasmata archaeon]|nr:hypothetical protein [Thermoplasmata archaeon]